ncbi:uncharacterized protein LOC142227174 [Haematobia irritans]|uniref:uncharacterized protein LOC142227174 n=1 Tax=Haematobia irritans TaxID=7368 RepID=UPI003F50CFA2
MSIMKFIPLCLILQNFIDYGLSKEFMCFIPTFTHTSWTDRRPDYVVNMTFGDQGAVTSETTVTREILNPVTKFSVLQKDGTNPPVALYNITARLCDLSSVVNKVPMVKQAFGTVTKQSNMTFECPLKPGFYVMGNMRIASRNPILSFMYKPRVTYTFAGGAYEELENKKLVALSTYNFTIKVVKKSCKE